METISRGGIIPQPKKIPEASEEEAIDFILVAIKRPAGEAGRDRNPRIAIIRRAIHDASEEYGVPITEMAYVQGVKEVYGRIPIARAHATLLSVHRTLQDYVEDFRASRPVTEPQRRALEERREAEQKRRRHRARVMRAAAIGAAYIDQFGDDLPPTRPVGRHAKETPRRRIMPDPAVDALREHLKAQSGGKYTVEVYVPGLGWTYGGDEYPSLRAAEEAKARIARETGREVRVLDPLGTNVG